MKSIVKTITVLAVASVLIFSTETNAKDKEKKRSNNSSFSENGGSGYKTGLGLRAGNEGGITLKHFIKSERALEGILSWGWNYGGMRITGLYEVNKPFPNAKGLSWFYGGGAHLGLYNGNYYGYSASGNGYYDKHGNFHPTGYSDNYTTVGIDGIIGLEYQFSEIPFTIGLDIKPFIDLVGSGDHYGDGALSFRYTFK